jgi:hypothetical protein
MHFHLIFKQRIFILLLVQIIIRRLRFIADDTEMLVFILKTWNTKKHFQARNLLFFFRQNYMNENELKYVAVEDIVTSYM